MYQIKHGCSGVKKIDGVNEAAISNDPTSPEWAAYQAWLAAGNTPLPDPEMTPAKIAERAAAAQAVADRRADIIAKVAGFTDGHIDNYIDSNVTNLAGAVAYLKRLTKVMRNLAIETGVD